MREPRGWQGGVAGSRRGAQGPWPKSTAELSKSQISKYLQPFPGQLWGLQQGREGAELVRARNGGSPSSLPLERPPDPSPSPESLQFQEVQKPQGQFLRCRWIVFYARSEERFS